MIVLNRRLLSLLLIGTLIATGVPLSVFVNGEHVEFPDRRPVIVDNRTLVPLRGVFEAMGATVDWEPEALRATVHYRGHQVAVFTWK